MLNASVHSVNKDVGDNCHWDIICVIKWGKLYFLSSILRNEEIAKYTLICTVLDHRGLLHCKDGENLHYTNNPSALGWHIVLWNGVNCNCISY